MPAGPAPTTATRSSRGVIWGMTSGMPGRLVPLDEEPLHRPDRERAVDVAAAAGALARGRADVRAHRRDRVRLAGQDVALFEAPLGGEVEVAPAVGADGTGLLALDVALEPGGVHGLDEELLGLVEGHEADVPFLQVRAGRREASAEGRRRRSGDYQAGRRRASRGPAGARSAAPRRSRLHRVERAAMRPDAGAGRPDAPPEVPGVPARVLTHAWGAATLAACAGRARGRHRSRREPIRDRVPGPRPGARRRRRRRSRRGASAPVPHAGRSVSRSPRTRSGPAARTRCRRRRHRRPAGPSPVARSTEDGPTTTMPRGAGDGRRRAEPAVPQAVPGRTRVPSVPAGIPAGPSRCPSRATASVPVGPGAMTHGPPPAGAADDAERRAQASATSRPRRGRRARRHHRGTAVLAGHRSPRPATVSTAADVGPTRAAASPLSGRGRPIAAPAAPVLAAAAVAVPVTRPAGRRRPGPREPSDERRRAGWRAPPASRRPMRPSRAGSWTSAARSRTRPAQRQRAPPTRCARPSAPTTSCAARLDRAEQVADPREVAAAKDGSTPVPRRERRRDARRGGRGRRTRVARRDQRAQQPRRARPQRFLEAGDAELRGRAAPDPERLAAEADAARISARERRGRLPRRARAAGGLRGGRRPAARDARPDRRPRSRTRSTSLAGRTRVDPDPPAGSPGARAAELLAACRSSSGSCAATARPASGSWRRSPPTTRTPRATWQLRVSRLVDAIAARAIEDGYLDLPDDDPFWRLFEHARGARHRGRAVGARLPLRRAWAASPTAASRPRATCRSPWATRASTGCGSGPGRASASRRLYAQAVGRRRRVAGATRPATCRWAGWSTRSGARAADLADLWNAWGRVRPALLARTDRASAPASVLAARRPPGSSALVRRALLVLVVLDHDRPGTPRRPRRRSARPPRLAHSRIRGSSALGLADLARVGAQGGELAVDRRRDVDPGRRVVRPEQVEPADDVHGSRPSRASHGNAIALRAAG